MERIWEIEKIDTHLARSLSETLGTTEITSSLLLKRKIKEEREARVFLYPTEADLYDPFLLEDMESAVKRIFRAIDLKERICIFGHEDVDGITATVTLLETLRDIGALVDYYIPNRAEEGHSLSKKSIDKAKERDTSLIVTVDCEVTNQEVVDYAQKHEIEIIVTDHHEITRELPSLTYINPKRKSSRYPNPFLSGVGVAHKLAQATAQRRLNITSAQWESTKGHLLTLVLFGTIADRVPLIGENRIYLVRGEKMLPKSQRVAIRVLQEKGFPLRIDSVMGEVVPILSSARSKDGYNKGCEFLMTTDYDQALQIFSELKEFSDNWYAESKRMYEKVRKRTDSRSKLIIVVDSTIPPYHLGYCANRLKEEFFKPSIVISLKGEYYIGEGRSIGCLDLVGLLMHCDDLLIDYGGHKQAAGFSIAEHQLATFVERARDYVDSNIKWNDLVRKIFIDLEISPSGLTEKVKEELKLFSPFGEGNRAPTFLIKGITLKEIYRDHIKIEKNGVPLAVKTRGSKGKWVSLSGQPIKIDCVISLGSQGILYLVDSRPSFTQIEQ